jgi:hypothetical protein
MGFIENAYKNKNRKKVLRRRKKEIIYLNFLLGKGLKRNYQELRLLKLEITESEC